MITLDQAIEERRLVEADIADLQEELAEINELIVKLSEQSVPTSLWTDPDENGGRKLKPMMELKELFRTGTRAQRMYEAMYEDWNLKGLFATLTEECPEQHMAWYSEAQTRHFAAAIVGFKERLALCRDPETEEWIEGYAIPWTVNAGPRESTAILERRWSAPDYIYQLTRKAERHAKMMDRRYVRAQRMNEVGEFFEKFPWYIED